MALHIRSATMADVPALRVLIDTSVRVLQAGDYTPEQIDGALATVYGVDTQLIADGTYFLVEDKKESEATPEMTIAGCGGWSKRKTLFGGDQFRGREDTLLNPRGDAAKIRAFFVHPSWARRGVGSLILQTCEDAARAQGFTRLEMGATLTGVPFYEARGYFLIERIDVSLGGGLRRPIVRMGKSI